MTEEEAKTKWCPFARVNRGQNASNRDSEGFFYPAHKCIGTACMAWRLLYKYPDPTKAEIAVIGGYCGLAGRP